MAILVVFICLFNIVMWIVFLRKFKKLFTTDDIVSDARAQMERLLADLNRNTERNLSLVDGTVSSLRALNAEAEKRIKILSEMEKQGVAVAQFKSDLGSAVKSTGTITEKRVSAYTKNRGTSKEKLVSLQNGTSSEHRLQKPDADSAFSLTTTGEALATRGHQKTVIDNLLPFESQEDYERTEPATAENDSASELSAAQETEEQMKEIPVISPKIYVNDVVSKTKQRAELRRRIMELSRQGYDVQAIASEVNCSVNEVELALSIAGLL